MRLGELCAGYGGLGMAVEEVFGATTAWFSEFDDAPSKILAHHWPDVPNYGDMTKIDWAAIEPVDIISGGTPCQDLSTAGRRAGMNEGTRSNLWVNMREAIAIQRPKYVVWENVRGAFSACASSEMGQCPGCVDGRKSHRPFLRALGRVLGDLSDLGFDAEWRGLRASDVGACHGRFRVFVLAANRDHIREYRARQWAEQDRWGQLADSGLSIPHAGSQGLALSGAGGIAPRQDASTAVIRDHALATDAERSAIERLSNSPVREEERGAAPRGLSETNWGEYAAAIHRWERTIGRPAPRPTERSGRNQSHRLSPRFTEWMMGLSDGWVTDPAIGITRNEQLKACGNGVVPQQAMAALRDMLAAFQPAEVAA